MRCPFCNHPDTAVKDSRGAEDNASIRRRRQCSECGGRFTTAEHVQLLPLKVIKKSGDQESFKREKLLNSICLALHKRSISEDKIHKITNSLIRQLEAQGETEISTQHIGELIMDTLKDLDSVAYVRFASVYKDFREAGDFSRFVKNVRDKNNNLDEAS